MDKSTSRFILLNRGIVIPLDDFVQHTLPNQKLPTPSNDDITRKRAHHLSFTIGNVCQSTDLVFFIIPHKVGSNFDSFLGNQNAEHATIRIMSDILIRRLKVDKGILRILIGNRKLVIHQHIFRKRRHHGHGQQHQRHQHQSNDLVHNHTSSMTSPLNELQLYRTSL